MLNLFLALLLNSFASDNLHKNTEVRDKSKVKQGWERLKNIFKNKRIQVQPSGEATLKRHPSIANIIDELRILRNSEKATNDTVIAMPAGETGSEQKAASLFKKVCLTIRINLSQSVCGNQSSSSFASFDTFMWGRCFL